MPSCYLPICNLSIYSERSCRKLENESKETRSVDSGRNDSSSALAKNKQGELGDLIYK